MSQVRPARELRAADAPEETTWFKEAAEKLHSLLHLSRGWDSYDAEPPNERAVVQAEQVLSAAHSTGYRPDRILPSVEGGVVISFRRGDRYGDIECDNEGDRVALISDGQGQIDAWEVASDQRSLEDAINRIGRHVCG